MDELIMLDAGTGVSNLKWYQNVWEKYDKKQWEKYVNETFDLFKRANIVSLVDIVENKKLIFKLIAESKEISALVDNARFSHTVSSSAFLIQTRTDSTLKYSYLYYEDGRGYAFDEANAKSCYINYTDGAPRLDIYHPYFTNGFVKWLLKYPIFTDYDYVFYLPQDAEVIDSFVIDFE